MTLFWTPLLLIFGLAVFFGAAAVSLVSWRRGGFARNAGLLELLRLAIIALVLFTLAQPEWTRELLPTERPTIAVVHDVSGSMETRDALNPRLPSSPPKSRAEAVEPLLAEAVWTPIASRMDVVFEPFSSASPTGIEATDLNGALAQASRRHKNLAGVVLLSDGDWNVGSAPFAAATELRMKRVPVFAVTIGSEKRLPDVALVGFDVPTFGVVGKPIRIPFVIESSLPRDYEVTASLTTSDGEEVSRSLRVPAMGRLHDTILWHPKKVGDFSLSLHVPKEPSEVVAGNNDLAAPIAIRGEAIRVLLVESYPRWEYRYLRNALERDPGVEVRCLLFHPDLHGAGAGPGYLDAFPSESELFDHDVVFLGDVGARTGQLAPEHCEQLRRLVRAHAGGIVFLPGFRGYQLSLLETELEDLVPVVLDETQPRGWGSPLPSQLELSEAGQRSLLTQLAEDEQTNQAVWRSLPGFQWYAAVLRAKTGSEVLAVHGSESNRFGRVPLLVTRTSGTGKILFMGTDGAWRWREGVEDLYHYRFWGQVVRWMAYQRSMSRGESMRLFYTPDRPRANTVVTLNANAMSDSGEPLNEGTVVVQVVSPSGKTDSIRLTPAGKDSWGLFTGTLTPTEGGSYRLVTTCRENGARLETQLSVRGEDREKRGQPARHDVMEEIAQVTRGRMAVAGKIRDVLAQITSLPEPEPILHRFRLWCHPAWGGLIVLLLVLFWVARKSIGMV